MSAALALSPMSHSDGNRLHLSATEASVIGLALVQMSVFLDDLEADEVDEIDFIASGWGDLQALSPHERTRLANLIRHSPGAFDASPAQLAAIQAALRTVISLPRGTVSASVAETADRLFERYSLLD